MYVWRRISNFFFTNYYQNWNTSSWKIGCTSIVLHWNSWRNRSSILSSTCWCQLALWLLSWIHSCQVQNWQTNNVCLIFCKIKKSFWVSKKVVDKWGSSEKLMIAQRRISFNSVIFVSKWWGSAEPGAASKLYRLKIFIHTYGCFCADWKIHKNLHASVYSCLQQEFPIDENGNLGFFLFSINSAIHRDFFVVWSFA